MCGIVGIRRFDGQPVTEMALRAMSEQLTHRGPDGEGYWCSGPVGLGHRRLSIIDLAGSAQPMHSSDGRLHVTFNGEILNFSALRRSVPYPYRTQGDTEVLLAVFAAHGPDGVAHLHGQYAYALHDSSDGSTWLVRDRLGILPLYYYLDDRVLIFGSEVKALIAVLPVPLEVDHSSLGNYLAGRSVPAPHTLFKGIHKLPAGHRLRVLPDGRTELVRYWSIPEAEPTSDVSDGAAVSLVGDALERAVEEALVADVPVGAYLSGGVDSSLIVALMAKLRAGAGVETFSAGFGEPRLDELPFARQVSAALGTRHHEVTVTPSDFQELWPKLTRNRDAPLSEPADVAVYRLAALARERVKVVLSGEGSDELFAGYPKYRFAGLVAGADAMLPSWARMKVATSLERALPVGGNRLRIALRAAAAGSDEERMQAWFAPFTASERVRLLGDGQRAWQPEVIRSAAGDRVRRMLYVDCHAWLADNLLERGDRMSMAASLELRPPFLDHRLVDLAFRLPTRVKVKRGVGKWVVKEVARRHLAAEIVDRPKAGFRVPLRTWFRGDLRDMARDSLLSPRSFVADVMDRRGIELLLDDHDRGRRNEEIRLWTLLSLNVWHDVFFTAPQQTVAAAQA